MTSVRDGSIPNWDSIDPVSPCPSSLPSIGEAPGAQSPRESTVANTCGAPCGAAGAPPQASVTPPSLLSILHYAGIKAQQISAQRFRLLNYLVVLRFRVDREGGIFPSISVKIDLKEAWKRLLPCEESESQQRLPADFHLSHLLLLAYGP